MADNAKLVAHLRALALLTQTEAQVAQTRVAQARTDAVRKELTENSKNADDRTTAILDMIRVLGGVPDVITPAIGRVTSVVKAALEQVEPLDEALLGDLALEHQLLDRARYLKVLAGTAESAKVGKLAERLIVAHTATVEWLTTVLAEEALGGPAALMATPFQRVAGTTVKAANTPSRYLAGRVNKTVDNVAQTTASTREQIGSSLERAGQITGFVRDALVTGRNATLGRAEKLARRDGDKAAAKDIHETRRDLGAFDASELPIKNYDGLNQAQAIAAADKLRTAKDARAIIRYEETHKNRSHVISAVQTTLAGIAQQAAGISK